VHWRTIAAPRPSSGSACQPGSEAGSTVRADDGPLSAGPGAGRAGGDAWGEAGGEAGGRAWRGREAGGAEAHPTVAAIAQAMITRSERERVMWVIYLEAVVAVSLVLLIVWWTMRGK
jgi:hypothetical protein